jgi:hypothetical protein
VIPRTGHGRGAADIVFCLDASASMGPVFEGVRRHIGEFLRELDANPQVQWDWRMDFIAHSAGIEDREFLFRHESVLQTEAIDALYSSRPANLTDAKNFAGRLWRKFRGHTPTLTDRQAVHRPAGPEYAFFVPAVDTFVKGLSRIQPFGDEATLIALDTCLDLPWRPASSTHRVIVLMTDEAPEAGVAAELQSRALPNILRKVVEKRVALHMVAPESSMLDLLSQADRSEYIVLRDGGPGLGKVNFAALLREVGQSVSRSLAAPIPTLEPEHPIGPALFGQDTWSSRTSRLTGA